MTAILGISAFYHDSAAALVIDGKLVAAAQEERFTRKKNDASFPSRAIAYVLQEAGIEGKEISFVTFYEKPFIKFERLLETYHAFAPKGFFSFAKAMPVWIKEKLYTKRILREELLKQGIRAELLFPEHHLSHAASAFYPSPYQEAAILTVDGVGEWATTTISKGKDTQISLLRELHFPHSLGLLYSAFTYYCGFKVNSGEYKLMGLAPYGDPEKAQKYIDIIKKHLIDIREDGSFLLNMKYFDFATGLKMTCDKRWKQLFGVPPRKPESEIQPVYIQMAYAVQAVTEEVILKLAATAKRLTQSDSLVMAGGVALNCVANGKIRESGLFRNIWIQPAAGDAGGAVGAALATWHLTLKNERSITGEDRMQGSYLGPSFTDKEVQCLIRRTGAIAQKLEQEVLCEKVAGFISEGKIIGWFQGRMEFGPRALGNRSILADPRNREMQRKLNLEIKNRESFRPFAPSVLVEDANHYFALDNTSSPYMLLVTKIKEEHQTVLSSDYQQMDYMQKLYTPRSVLQAITHVDFSARVQTVAANTSPIFHKLLTCFKARTGCGVLVNTSFNVRGEPIVCTPDDAYTCFINTGMDFLVINNWLFTKQNKN